MARRGKKIRQGFRLTVILLFLVILLALLAVVMLLSTGSDSPSAAAPTTPPVSIKDFDRTEAQSEPPKKESGLLDRLFGSAGSNKVNETEGQTFGIDVAKYQGTIDWAEVAQSGVEFAMIRMGYRKQENGEILDRKSVV